jgi:ABC-type branched-subunit amino acid transport system permease subunit
MARLDNSDQIHLEAEPVLRGWVRYCLGILSLAAAICLGFGAYACFVARDIARAIGGRGDKAHILGITLPFPIMVTLLVVLCLLSAFAAVYALFFPTQSPMEN